MQWTEAEWFVDRHVFVEAIATWLPERFPAICPPEWLPKWTATTTEGETIEFVSDWQDLGTKQARGRGLARTLAGLSGDACRVLSEALDAVVQMADHSSNKTRGSQTTRSQAANAGGLLITRLRSHWVATFREQEIDLPSLSGSAYIAELVQHPAKVYSAIELERGSTHDRELQPNAPTQDTGDDAAIKALRDGMTELEEMLAEAEKNNDLGAIELHAESLAALESELQAYVDPAGRRNRLGNDHKKAIDRVQHAISRTIREISRATPGPAAHLDEAISGRGGFTYRPQ